MSELLSYKDWIEYLEEKASRISRIQMVISNFEVLPRLGSLLSKQSESCAECMQYWKRLQEATVDLDKFFDDGNTLSVEFENLVSEIYKHLKNTHKIRPKGFIVSLYSLIGMILGIAIGVFFGWIFDSFKGFVILGWVIGVLAGWIIGKSKEVKMQKANLLF